MLIALILFDLALSIRLSWHFLNREAMLGCGAGSSCEQVLNSPWSVFAGVFPVSGLAVGAYLALFVCTFFITPSTETSLRKIAWKAILILAGAIGGSAVWFTVLQKWFIGEFCPYCMSAHIAGLLLVSLIVWRSSKEQGVLNLKKGNIAGLTGAGLGLAVVLAVSQVLFTPPSVYQEGQSQDSQEKFDYGNSPVIGSPDAEYLVTVLFDYQCPHCQRIHFMLNDIVDKYNGKLAFVLCPAPLNAECNPFVSANSDRFRNSCELARIALAVWVADRNVFHEFERWMFTFETGDIWRPRKLEAAETKAAELVGEAKLNKALDDPWVEKYLMKCIEIYGRTMQNGSGGIPKLICGSLWVIPQPDTSDDLLRIMQNSLQLPDTDNEN